MKLGLKLLVSLSLFASSCATPPDVPLCLETGPESGWCMTTISEKEFTIDEDHLLNKKQWWEVKAGSLLIPAESWGQIKAYLLKMCKKTNKCGDLSRWDKKAKKLESKSPRLQKESRRSRVTPEAITVVN